MNQSNGGGSLASVPVVARPMPAAEAWLRDNAEKYAGRWVALRDDELVAVADSFVELRSRLRADDDVLVTLVT